MSTLNITHDPNRLSWVSSANGPGTDFPIQNLPHGVFRKDGVSAGGIAIGDQVLDLKVAIQAGLFSEDLVEIAEAAAEPTLNGFLAMGNEAASRLRRRVSDILWDMGTDRSGIEGLPDLLVPMAEVSMELPVRIGGFTDFCTSVYHMAEDRLNRLGAELHPAFKNLPIAYNGRANSVVVDGTAIQRPTGQTGNPKTGQVNVRPTRSLDFELEFGALIGQGNVMGRSIDIDDVRTVIWGYVLVNDWSARDFQLWESMLGPFLGKSFATTISPWIVTSEAMAPFLRPAHERDVEDPAPQPYLTSERHAREGGLEVTLTAYLKTTRMREEGDNPVRLTDTRLSYAYWSMEQMVAHHTLNGCPLAAGDLLSSGTVSGPEEHAAACLWEMTGGKTPIGLSNGETRVWLEDGDEIILRGQARNSGSRTIGFGMCRGIVV